MRVLSYIGLVLLSLLIGSCGRGSVEKTEKSFASGSDENVNAEIIFEETVRDLGSIREGEKIVAWFEYTNNGSGPLLIEDIEAGCGCTIPSWSKSPLEPGNTGSIKVIFDSSGKRGVQNIRISVFSNSTQPRIDLSLKAIVVNNL